MNPAPLAPDCRHCGATNDSGASECWQCHRRDWRPPPPPPPEPSRHTPRPTFVGCLVVAAIAIALIEMVSPALRGGRLIGTVTAIVGLVILALAIALFALCTALASL